MQAGRPARSTARPDACSDARRVPATRVCLRPDVTFDPHARIICLALAASGATTPERPASDDRWWSWADAVGTNEAKRANDSGTACEKRGMDTSCSMGLGAGYPAKMASVWRPARQDEDVERGHRLMSPLGLRGVDANVGIRPCFRRIRGPRGNFA
jgi:hypothetical protein